MKKVNLLIIAASLLVGCGIFLVILAVLLGGCSYEGTIQLDNRVNIAEGKATTASSEYAVSGNAVDGDWRTAWISQEGDSSPWLVVDLGYPEHVTQAQIVSNNVKERVKACTVQYGNDGSTFTNAASGTLCIPGTITLDLDHTARYWRLSVTSMTASRARVYEFKLKQ